MAYTEVRFLEFSTLLKTKDFKTVLPGTRNRTSRHALPYFPARKTVLPGTLFVRNICSIKFIDVFIRFAGLKGRSRGATAKKRIFKINQTLKTPLRRVWGYSPLSQASAARCSPPSG